MYTVVTGAAGFIGSNLVKALNQRGITRIIAVDNLTRSAKFVNLVDCDLADYLDQDGFIAQLAAGGFDKAVGAVLHQGACSDTLEQDGRYLMENNYRYSVTLAEFCQHRKIPFIYASSASVYGPGPVFREAREHERPLNAYGFSKFLFDQWVRSRLPGASPIVGLRYFNVYGPREQHKERMASVAFHFCREFLETGRVRLFEASGGYGPGEQRRDFVFVEDVVKVNLFFLDHPEKSGIYNVGTGRAQTFNEVAVAVVNACRRAQGQQPQTLEALRQQEIVEYIPFPEGLKERYQSFTEADLGCLRGAGYADDFLTVEQGVSRYVAAMPRA